MFRTYSRLTDSLYLIFLIYSWYSLSKCLVYYVYYDSRLLYVKIIFIPFYKSDETCTDFEKLANHCPSRHVT